MARFTSKVSAAFCREVVVAIRSTQQQQQHCGRARRNSQPNAAPPPSLCRRSSTQEGGDGCLAAALSSLRPGAGSGCCPGVLTASTSRGSSSGGSSTCSSGSFSTVAGDGAAHLELAPGPSMPPTRRWGCAGGDLWEPAQQQGIGLPAWEPGSGGGSGCVRWRRQRRAVRAERAGAAGGNGGGAGGEAAGAWLHPVVGVLVREKEVRSFAIEVVRSVAREATSGTWEALLGRRAAGSEGRVARRRGTVAVLQHRSWVLFCVVVSLLVWCASPTLVVLSAAA